MIKTGAVEVTLEMQIDTDGGYPRDTVLVRSVLTIGSRSWRATAVVSKNELGEQLEYLVTNLLSQIVHDALAPGFLQQLTDKLLEEQVRRP